MKLTFWGWLRVMCNQEGELFPGMALIVISTLGPLWLLTRPSGEGNDARIIVLVQRLLLFVAFVYGVVVLVLLLSGPFVFYIGSLKVSGIDDGQAARDRCGEPDRRARIVIQCTEQASPIRHARVFLARLDWHVGARARTDHRLHGAKRNSRTVHVADAPARRRRSACAGALLVDGRALSLCRSGHRRRRGRSRSLAPGDARHRAAGWHRRPRGWLDRSHRCRAHACRRTGSRRSSWGDRARAPSRQHLPRHRSRVQGCGRGMDHGERLQRVGTQLLLGVLRRRPRRCRRCAEAVPTSG